MRRCLAALALSATLLTPAILLAPRTFAVTRAPVAADKAMVVTSQHLATQVGTDILKAGGNAIDAAVAVGYALAVTNPCCGNIGGGGFATLHLADGRDIFLNFREKAPLASTPTMYLDDKGEPKKDASLVGYLAAGVPGTVMGLDTLLSKYGTMKRAEVMAPAIKLANDGFTLDQGDVDILATTTKDFGTQPNVADIFLNGGQPWKPGDTLKQAKLGATLQQISDGGPDAFYKGPIADAVVKASQANGGIFAKQDFEKYTVEEMPPVKCTYRTLEVISSPPPSSGGTTICEILNILEGYDLKSMGFHSAGSIHAMAEAMRHAYVDRNFQLGDPDFVKNPIDKLTSKDYAAAIRATIDPNKATASADLKPGTPPHEGTQTTHFSIVDSAGNAVSITYTINALFGARVIAGDTGFLLNDEMDDFTVKPGVANMFGLVQGATNLIAPGKRPLSSMSPTLVKKDGKVYMVVGSPGGSRIITIVLETILNVVDHGMTIQEAVDAPRLHHQWLPDQISAEPFAINADTAKLLTDMGYKIVEQTPWGAAESILIGPATDPNAAAASSGNDAMAGGRPIPGKYYGAHDDRRSAGAAMGF